MKTDTLFEKMLGADGPLSSEVRDSAAWVTHTLDLCWAGAQAVFGERATPEMALAMFDRVVDDIESDAENDDDDEDDEDEDDD